MMKISNAYFTLRYLPLQCMGFWGLLAVCFATRSKSHNNSVLFDQYIRPYDLQQFMLRCKFLSESSQGGSSQSIAADCRAYILNYIDQKSELSERFMI